MPAARPHIAALRAYVPGEQPSPAETAAGAVVKLNTNENAYPPSPRVLDAVRGVGTEALRMYPVPDSAGFRAAAGRRHGLDPSRVIATNGGDELLRLLVTVFCDAAPAAAGAAPGGGLGVTDPSYSLYGVLAEIHGAAVTTVRRPDADDGGFALPPDLAERWNRAGCRLGFLVNPHAPSGRREGVDTLRQLADAFDGLLVIDEAYADFCPPDAAGGVDLVREGRDDVLVLRSLSKGYALAGLRFGYGLAAAEVIAVLDKARDSYNLDVVAQAAAAAAMHDTAYSAAGWARTRSERGRLTAALRERGYRVPDSHSNFVLATVPGPDAATRAERAAGTYAHLKERGVLVRYFRTPRLADRLRITVGTAAQNDRLLTTLDTAKR